MLLTPPPTFRKLSTPLYSNNNKLLGSKNNSIPTLQQISSHKAKQLKETLLQCRYELIYIY